MGLLKDTAKKNSNFLKLEKGEEITVTFLDFRIIPSQLDPTKETAQYKFGTPFGEKYWTNGNTMIMSFFDDLPKGTEVIIKRDKWFNKQGVEDAAKSSYSARKVGEAPDMAWQ